MRKTSRLVVLLTILLAPTVRATAGIFGECTQDSQCRPAIVNPCIVDKCINQACFHTPLCPNDGAVCNGDEQCIVSGNTGICVTVPLSCNDHDACTFDVCNEPTGCDHVARNCNDGDACTFDSCNPSTGDCVHEPVIGCCRSNADCPDEPCRLGRICTGAFCTGGTPRDCDDADPTTIDTCDPAVGCVHTSTAATTTTIPTGGSCAADVDCAPDGDACMRSACDPDSGCVSRPRDGFEAVACVCARPLPASCPDALPRRIARPSTKACGLVARAAAAGGKKQSRLVARTGRLLGRARKASVRSEDALPAGCADALAAYFADGFARAQAFRKQAQ